ALPAPRFFEVRVVDPVRADDRRAALLPLLHHASVRRRRPQRTLFLPAWLECDARRSVEAIAAYVRPFRGQQLPADAQQRAHLLGLALQNRDPEPLRLQLQRLVPAVIGRT